MKRELIFPQFQKPYDWSKYESEPKRWKNEEGDQQLKDRLK